MKDIPLPKPWKSKNKPMSKRTMSTLVMFGFAFISLNIVFMLYEILLERR